MTSKFRREWRTIDPENPRSIARRYASRADARPDIKQFPHRVLQQRFVSDWKDDN